MSPEHIATPPGVAATPQPLRLPPAVDELLRQGPPAGGWLRPEFEPGLVSVIIPAYNSAALIGETLASILAQTHDRVEVIVADDGSTDNTREVLAGWRERFRTGRGWELKVLGQPNRGPNAARNLALCEARGEFINSFDSDDLMAADRLAAGVRQHRAGDWDMVHGPWASFYSGRDGFFVTRERSFGGEGTEGLRAWLARPGLTHVKCLMRRSFVDRIGPWNERLVGGKVDSEYHARMLLLQPRMTCCPTGAVFVRRHLDSISFNLSPQAHANGVYWLTYLERRLEGEGKLPGYRQELARKFREYAVDAYRDGAGGLGDYCADRAELYDAGFFSEENAFRRLRFRILGMRRTLRAKGRSARFRRRRLRLARALGMTPRMEPATWMAALPLTPPSQ